MTCVSHIRLPQPPLRFSRTCRAVRQSGTPEWQTMPLMLLSWPPSQEYTPPNPLHIFACRTVSRSPHAILTLVHSLQCFNLMRGCVTGTTTCQPLTTCPSTMRVFDGAQTVRAHQPQCKSTLATPDIASRSVHASRAQAQAQVLSTPTAPRSSYAAQHGWQSPSPRRASTAGEMGKLPSAMP